MSCKVKWNNLRVFSKGEHLWAYFPYFEMQGQESVQCPSNVTNCGKKRPNSKSTYLLINMHICSYFQICTPILMYPIILDTKQMSECLKCAQTQSKSVQCPSNVTNCGKKRPNSKSTYLLVNMHVLIFSNTPILMYPVILDTKQMSACLKYD